MTHTVLLVDDDTEVLRSLARMLQMQPYQLYTAHSGEEAMSILKCRNVDVIVADERMPGMSGIDLLAWVAANYGDSVRMLLTGYASAESIARAVNEGAVWYVFMKPCNDAHLAIMIRKALDHKDDLANNAQLVEMGRRQATDRERLAKDLEALDRTIARDLKKPLHGLTQSCQLLLEEHGDLFDRKAKSLIEGSLEAISDMQALVDDLLARANGRQSAGENRHMGVEASPLTGNP